MWLYWHIHEKDLPGPVASRDRLSMLRQCHEALGEDNGCEIQSDAFSRSQNLGF